MLLKKSKTLIAKNAKSVHSADPLEAFKRQSRGEVGKYEIRGETWKSVRKLLLFALALTVFYFLRECYLAWNIFQ